MAVRHGNVCIGDQPAADKAARQPGYPGRGELVGSRGQPRRCRTAPSGWACAGGGLRRSPNRSGEHGQARRCQARPAPAGPISSVTACVVVAPAVLVSISSRRPHPGRGLLGPGGELVEVPRVGGGILAASFTGRPPRAGVPLLGLIPTSALQVSRLPPAAPRPSGRAQPAATGRQRALAELAQQQRLDLPALPGRDPARAVRPSARHGKRRDPLADPARLVLAARSRDWPPPPRRSRSSSISRNSAIGLQRRAQLLQAGRHRRLGGPRRPPHRD